MLAGCKFHEGYVLHVKPRCEKKVFLFLERYRCLRYLPLYVKVTKVQRRKVKRELPLFPGYVFACLDAASRRKMLETNLIVRTLPIPNPREVVHQLRQVARASKRGGAMAVVNPFREGDHVRVKSGPFRGLDGIMRREGAKSTIILNVDILGQAVETAVSPDDCEIWQA